ncbi:hypothetical protein LJB88_00375 [Erysipelotrichaceae bacterium OttesenSCG-928-M19]|nr:hypothetical protein [Erysipelotrichaceae bacterium OttesenSCG-928-M19]
MIINEIRKYGLVLSIIGILLVGLITRDLFAMMAYLAGSLASFSSLFINEKFLFINGTRNDMIKNFFGFLLRMLVYVVVLSFAFKFAGMVAMICAFLGCLTIRIAILIYGIKGGMMNERN